MNNPQKTGLVPRLRFPEFAGEWEIKKLNQVTSYVDYRGKTPEKSTSGVFLVTAKNIRQGYIDYEISKEYVQDKTYEVVMNRGKPKIGDVLITTEAPLGHVANIDREDIALAQRVIKLRGKNELMQNYFLKFYLLSEQFQKKLNENATGGTAQGIKGSTLHKMELIIPSTAEQQKIADCLSSVDELIAATAKRLAALQTHKKGLMQALFPCAGATVPRLRFPEFAEAGDWEVVPLSNIGQVLQGYGFPEVLQGKTDGDYPFCKVSDISNAVAKGNHFINHALNYINKDELVILKAKIIPIGTTIFAKIGEAIRSNRRVITVSECLIDNNVAGVKAIDGKADDLYIFYILSQINLIEYSAGAVPSVNKSTLENISVFKTSLKEQQKIADCLSSVDELIAATEKRLAALQTHKKGLMQALFPAPEA
jgi:type I restriction enzyme S subunit